MYKINILFEDREFEHDIYELIKAFYPEGEIHSLYEKQEECGDLFFRVEKKDGSFLIHYKNQEHTGVISADIIKGQNRGKEPDALVSCDQELRKENKDVLKYALYQLLVKLTGKTLPWGNLTGIRPVKLAMAMIEAGMKNTEVAEEMRKRYLVSPRKTALAVTIANRERELLKKLDYEKG